MQNAITQSVMAPVYVALTNVNACVTKSQCGCWAEIIPRNVPTLLKTDL
jgi:hypothetical protein